MKSTNNFLTFYNTGILLKNEDAEICDFIDLDKYIGFKVMKRDHSYFVSLLYYNNEWSRCSDRFDNYKEAYNEIVKIVESFDNFYKDDNSNNVTTKI